MAKRGDLKDRIRQLERDNLLLKNAVERMSREKGWGYSYAKLVERLTEVEDAGKCERTKRLNALVCIEKLLGIQADIIRDIARLRNEVTSIRKDAADIKELVAK